LKKTMMTAVVVTIAAGALLTGCAANETPANANEPANSASNSSSVAAPEAETKLSGTASGGGASSQSAAQEAWRAGFSTANADVTINYDPVGSGTGRENFTNGGFLFAGSDKAFAADKAAGPFEKCVEGSSLVEIPAYISPIALGFNLPGIDSLNLDSATIANIFTQKITKWNDPAIVALNDSVSLPDTNITAVHRSDKSGTTENFTDYIAATAPDAWPYEADEVWPEGLAGEAAEKTQGVRSTITSTEGAIGYLDASQAKEMGTVAIKVGDSFVAYSPEAAAAAVAASPQDEGRESTDVVVKLDRTLTDDGVYPMVLVSYLVACSQYTDAADATLVKAYLEYAISADGQAAAASNAGSAPITGSDLEPKVTAAVATIK
jgi:phosphate transport system substrate-binding protein